MDDSSSAVLIEGEGRFRVLASKCLVEVLHRFTGSHSIVN
jgi:hypothetical protein